MAHRFAACTLLVDGQASESAETTAQQGLVHKTAQSTFKHVPAKPELIESKQVIVALTQLALQLHDLRHQKHLKLLPCQA